ncbi:TraM recognition domain-containing protein (plasmid) [Alicyclobacillus sp. ALC3]|nr:TraM recognition domain-containing protein [Alicyclobacillus sp. ALC3]
MFGSLMTMFSIVALGAVGYAVFKVHHSIASWQHKTLDAAAKTTAKAGGKGTSTVHHATTSSNVSGIVNPLTSSGQGSPSSVHMPNLNAMSPLVHQNAWVTAVVLIGVVILAIGYLIYRGMSPTNRANLMSRLHAESGAYAGKRKTDPNRFEIRGIEVGVRKDNGKQIRIDGTDRFINTLVLGSIGTGKTSRVLSKGVYQDLRAVADGVPMDVIVVDPDGGFAQKAVDMAQKFNIHTDVMDLRGSMPSTVSFNPFAGGDIADIIDNVRAALQEKMGKQDGFFQNAQDDLVRTVIQVQVPLWPEADFLFFAELVTNPHYFRAICDMIHQYVTHQKDTPTPAKKKKNEEEAPGAMWEHMRPEVQARYDAASPAEQSMVFTAANSFRMDTFTEQKMEKLETITKGLKIVVNELASNPRLREVFSKDSLPAVDFKSFLAAGKDVPGRLLVIVTGNRPAGKLFGKLFLVALKMYTLERGGSEDTRRPVYLYVDEFAVFGTESFTEMFSQARKYRVGMMLAIQARSQLLDVSKKFMDVVEGSCRNKIYFPAPSPDDARFLENALGSTTVIKESHTENKLGWFGFDSRNLDRRISTHEAVDPRYRLEDIAYGLKADEAIFAITVDNQVQVPAVGLTSFADEWANRKRGFFKVNQAASVDAHQEAVGETSSKQAPRGFFPRPFRASMSAQSATAAPAEAVSEPETDESLTHVDVPTLTREASTKPSTYVLPEADPNKVIRLDKFLVRSDMPVAHERAETAAEANDPVDEPKHVSPEVRKSEEPIAEQTGETEPLPVTAHETTAARDEPVEQPQATRIDLRPKPKLCPKCETTQLELTDDRRKWHCPGCGFERKNR